MRKSINIPMLLLSLSAIVSAQAAKPAVPAPSANTQASKSTTSAPATTAQGKTAAPAKTEESKKSGIRSKIEAEKAKVEAALASKKKVEDKPKSQGSQDSVDMSKPMAGANKRRDPFLNPIVARPLVGPATVCTGSGPKCMSTDQIIVRGIVKTPGGMIAMVENAAKKEFNMREKDPILNGYVYKITGDSVIFRINTVNLMNVPTTQDVVKRVTVPTS
jgi:hypothetical protein